MKPYQEWSIVYEDNELDVRRNPEDPSEYGLNKKNTEDYLLLPRGTLEEIARGNREHGKEIIIRLMPYHLQGRFFEGTQLNYDSIIASIDKAYLKEEEEYRKEIKNKDRKDLASLNFG